MERITVLEDLLMSQADAKIQRAALEKIRDLLQGGLDVDSSKLLGIVGSRDVYRAMKDPEVTAVGILKSKTVESLILATNALSGEMPAHRSDEKSCD